MAHLQFWNFVKKSMAQKIGNMPGSLHKFGDGGIGRTASPYAGQRLVIQS